MGRFTKKGPKKRKHKNQLSPSQRKAIELRHEREIEENKHVRKKKIETLPGQQKPFPQFKSLVLPESLLEESMNIDNLSASLDHVSTLNYNST